MSLKKIVYNWQIDELGRGDKVDFVPDEVGNNPWSDRMVFYEKQLETLIFISKARTGKDIYQIGLTRSDFNPTDLGLIRIRNRSTGSYSKYEPDDPEYEMLLDVLNTLD